MDTEQFLIIFQWLPRYNVLGNEALNMAVSNGSFLDQNSSNISIPAKEKTPLILRIQRDIFKPTTLALAVGGDHEIIDLPAKSSRRIVSARVRGDSIQFTQRESATVNQPELCATIKADDHDSLMIPGSFQIVFTKRTVSGYRELSIINVREDERGGCATIRMVPYDVHSYIEIEAFAEIGAFRAVPVTQ